MKESFVSGLEPNDRVTSYFVVQSKEVRFKKQNGEAFLSLRLADRSGQIEAKMWDGVDEIADTFAQDDFVKIRGAVQVFRDQPQIIIHKLRFAAESEVELADFVPHTNRDINEMFAELMATIEGFENEDLKRLMHAFFDDPETAARFKKAPAAKSMHHGFVGGLLEHVMSLLNLAKLVASNYSYIDRDLLQTGVLLHDLGKIFELGYERSFYYTDDGQLLGHITMVVSMVDRKCAELDNFPHKLKVLVQHMLLSHHGRYEFGSPKLPMFPEALALSYIDDLDSKLESMRAGLAEMVPEATWSRFNPALDRMVLCKESYLAEQPAEVPLAAPAEPPALPTQPPLLESTPEPEPKTAGGNFADKLRSALDD